MMKISATVFICTFTIASCVPAFFFPDQFEKLYETWLDTCTENEEMPYFNKSLNTFQCYPILEKGPCEPNYWFVLDAETPHEAHCVKQPCACEESENLFDLGNDTDSNGEPACIYEYDYSNNILYNRVMFDGSCQDIQDTEACPDGQEIQPNPYGQGECGCIKGFLQHFNKNESLSCYQEYLQGPCEEGEQYILSGEKDNFKPICAPTNCGKNETRFNDICFPLINCDQFEHPDDIVVFNLQTKTTSCSLGMRGGNLIGGINQCAEGERKDARGDCKKTYDSGNRQNRRSPTTYGGGRRLRDVCCS